MSSKKQPTEAAPAVGPLAAPEARPGSDAEAGASGSVSTAVPEMPSPDVPLAPEQLTELKARAAKADEHWDRLLRAKADLDNYRKRAARERHEAVRFANLGLMEKLIPSLDSLEMALAASRAQDGAALDAVRTGIAMVQQQLRATLTEAGLQEIDAAGQAFDPNLHEAVAQRESADVPEGRVLEQLRKGYRLHDRLIRPATVVVSKAPAA